MLGPLLAGLVRSGAHLAWVAAVTCEATLTLIGLVRVATGQYVGGTLLAIATLGLWSIRRSAGPSTRPLAAVSRACATCGSASRAWPRTRLAPWAAALASHRLFAGYSLADGLP